MPAAGPLISASPHRNDRCRHCHYLHRPPPLVGNHEQFPAEPQYCSKVLPLEDVVGSTGVSLYFLVSALGGRETAYI